MQVHRALGPFGGQFKGQARGGGGPLQCRRPAAVLACFTPRRHGHCVSRPHAAGNRKGEEEVGFMFTKGYAYSLSILVTYTCNQPTPCLM